MRGLMFLVVVSLLATPVTAAEEVLTWLLHRPLQKAPRGRYNARDLSVVVASSSSSSSSSFYDPYQDLRLCNSDRVCERREFCDQHYGVCRTRVKAGQHCRRDAMCGRDLDCLSGVCQERVEPGSEGARCRKEKDCGPDMCCARRNGEYVCQRRLPLGHKCYVPEGGPEYAINERCPCQMGLICKYTSPEPPPRNPAEFWATYEHMRCVPPSHSPHAS